MFTLHIDTGAEMRGGQWQALYLLRGLAARGQRVRLLAPPGSPLLQAALAQHMEARPLRMTALAGAAAGADLIHAHDARAHTVALWLGKPVAVSRRVAFPVRSGFASRWKYGRAAQFIAVSEYVRQTLIEAGVEAARISVVYDGVPIPPPAKASQRSRVLALDSEDPHKGKAIIERAAALADLPVAFSRNLSRDLPEAALFVYITDLEGLGSAALLAMAHGVPVIASDVGGLREVIEDGVTGVLTQNEPEALARHIRHLLEDRAFATRLVARARIRVEKMFSVDRMVDDTICVYERILNCSKLA
ncbi:MAG TPA: glycosyltransferase family 4 protein [Bryobacteraceae bacterium]|nr:glycosyltransferase family 4 protein [Bryobacteraceae bacterium]